MAILISDKIVFGAIQITGDKKEHYNMIKGLVYSGVCNLLAALGHTGRRVVLGHTLNTQTIKKTDEQKEILSKFTILCWATFIAILGHMRPAGHGLDTPA